MRYGPPQIDVGVLPGRPWRREVVPTIRTDAGRVKGEVIVWQRIRAVTRRLARSPEEGMTTAEYAVGTLAAVTFAIVLLAVVKSGAVKSALAAVITTALGMGG
jgi:hypothetical protein